MVNWIINVFRKGVGLPPHDFVEIRASIAEAKAITTDANVLSARPQPGVGVAESVLGKGDVVKCTLKVDHFFDQGSRNEGTVEEDYVASTQQMLVLKRLSDLQHNTLAFDMDIWGPYTARRERHFQKTTYHLNADAGIFATSCFVLRLGRYRGEGFGRSTRNVLQANVR